MIYFCITLRAKEASKDWSKVTADFNRTLRSVFRQTDPNFKVFVACHDIPELEDEYDDRLEFITTDVRVPETPWQMMQDKGYKLTMLALKVRELGGGYTMVVDADDLVSNRIAEYCNAHPNETGFLSEYGYIWTEGDDWCKRMIYPHKTCGSCAIINYSVDDLPDTLPESPDDDEQKNHYLIRFQHYTIPNELKKRGRKLKELPFISTLYVRGTGENHSLMTATDLRFKRRVELSLRFKIKLSKVWSKFSDDPYKL